MMQNIVDPNRIIYYGVVRYNEDPLNLGRIIAKPESWTEEAYENAFGKLKEDEKWTSKNPFIVNPLIPIFLYQVPKIGEFVHIIFYNKEYTENNIFYIQGSFSNINEIYFQKLEDSVGNLAQGERNKKANDTTSPTTGIPVNTENQGLYPVPKTVALLGRKNSDILLPEDGFIARIDKQVLPSDTPTFKKNYSFTMLQKYPNKKGQSTFSENKVTNRVIQNLSYLIEYNVYGGLGVFDGKYSAYIEVYKISNYTKVSTSGYTENQHFDVPEQAKIGPIFRKDYQGETLKNIITGFNSVIKNLNDQNRIGLVGSPSGSTVENPFPFVYQPTKQLEEKRLNSNDTQKKNIQRFIDNVFLNVNQTNRGYALVSQKDTFGILTENVSVESEQPNYEPDPTTVGMTVADTLYFLSHKSDIPGLQIINFQNVSGYTDNVMDENFIWDTVLPNTNSMVRGEKLLELLELIVNFMINHVHPFHNMPPVSVSKDGTSTQEILTKVFNGYNEILNEKLRIN